MGGGAQTPSEVVQNQTGKGYLLEVHQKPGASKKIEPAPDEIQDEGLAWLEQGAPREEKTPIMRGPEEPEKTEPEITADLAEPTERPLNQDDIDQRLVGIDHYREKQNFDTARRLERKLVEDSMRPFPIPEYVKDLIAERRRWALKDQLGKGGMGAVYRAHDLNLRKDAAIKVMMPLGDGSLSEEFKKRFRREGTSLARLNNPYVVRVYDAEFDKEGGFIAMDLVDGKDLDDQIKEHEGTYSVDEAARIGLDVAHGLAAMHEAGVVHRDIKPANVIFSKRYGHNIIADFGLTYLLDQKDLRHVPQAAAGAADPRLTDPQFVLGTPYYISPENAVGSEKVGPATDIWALGVMLYHLTAGKMPFEGENPVEILGKVARVQVWPLKTYRPDLPESFLRLVDDMMNRNPDRRPTAEEVASRLKDVLLEKHIAIVKPPESVTPSSQREPTATSIVRRPLADSEIETRIMAGRPSVEDTERVQPAEPEPATVADEPSGIRRFFESIKSMLGK